MPPDNTTDTPRCNNLHLLKGVKLHGAGAVVCDLDPDHDGDHRNRTGELTWSDEVMTQMAPYPLILADLVNSTKYREGWEFSLQDIDRGQGSAGLTFVAIGQYPNTYHPEQMIRVAHYFPVLPAAYDERSWRRWLFDRILDIERHESAEFFQIDGKRPYAPHHGPGNDPYLIFEHGTDLDVRTSFRGEVDQRGL